MKGRSGAVAAKVRARKKSRITREDDNTQKTNLRSASDNIRARDSDRWSRATGYQSKAPIVKWGGRDRRTRE